MQNTELKIHQLLIDRWSGLQASLMPKQYQCYRLLHDLKFGFQADIYGETLWVYWYNDTAPTENVISQISRFATDNKMHFVLRHMINRGVGVGGKESVDLVKSKNIPEEWTAFENQIQFQLRTNAGFSPGLFLDQRENRKWVFENSLNKKVLNLFSYTSGFSVAAALGNPEGVTTVDASSNFLNWSKENFLLNQLQPENYEFFAQDSLLFLSGSGKRNRAWDLIICDPPSFGRTKTTLWRIEKDLPDLILKMWACLADGGQILFTCNYEKWTLSELESVFRKTLSGEKFKLIKLPTVGVDFELTASTQNLTKGFILHKQAIKSLQQPKV